MNRFFVAAIAAISLTSASFAQTAAPAPARPVAVAVAAPVAAPVLTDAQRIANLETAVNNQAKIIQALVNQFGKNGIVPMIVGEFGPKGTIGIMASKDKDVQKAIKAAKAKAAKK